MSGDPNARLDCEDMDRATDLAWERLKAERDEWKARAEKAEAENSRLNRSRVHCENCGADYIATGIEAGCPCRLQAANASLREIVERLPKTADGLLLYPARLYTALRQMGKLAKRCWS